MGDLYAYICARVCEYEICMYTYIHMRSRDLSHPQKHTRYCHTQTHTRYYQELGSAAYVESCLLIRGMFSSRSHTHTPTHTHTHTNTHTHTRTARTHTLTQQCTRARRHLHTCMHAHKLGFAHIHTHSHSCWWVRDRRIPEQTAMIITLAMSFYLMRTGIVGF